MSLLHNFRQSWNPPVPPRDLHAKKLTKALRQISYSQSKQKQSAPTAQCRQSIQVDPQAKTATFPATAAGSEDKFGLSLQTSTIVPVKFAATVEGGVRNLCLKYPGLERPIIKAHLKSLVRWLAAA